MAEIRQYVCDVCGARKGESNHWWKITIDDSINVRHWGDNREYFEDRNMGVFHICGEVCVLKKVSEFMGAK